MITVSQFRIEFPEFNDAPDSLVSAYLTRAITLTPDVVWGGSGPDDSLTEQGTLVRCAQLLAQSPFSRHLAKSDNGESVYDRRLSELKRIVTSGMRNT